MKEVVLDANIGASQGYQQAMQQKIDLIAERGERLCYLQDTTGTLSASAQMFRQALKPKSSTWGSGFKKSSGKGNAFQGFFQSLLPGSGTSSYASPAPPPPTLSYASPAPPPPTLAPSMSSSFTRQLQFHITQTEGISQSSFLAEYEEEDESLSFSLCDDAPSPTPPPLAAQPTGAPPALNLTVERIARSQKFDGSFPTTSDFLTLLLGSATLPALPSGLTTCSSPKEIQESVWVTLLTLAVLEKRFASENAAWELLAEKSIRFVETVLAGGLVTGNVGEFVAGLRGEAAKHV